MVSFARWAEVMPSKVDGRGVAPKSKSLAMRGLPKSRLGEVQVLKDKGDEALETWMAS